MQELGINLEMRVIEWSLNSIDTRILRKCFQLFGFQMLYKLTQQLCKLMDSDGGRVLDHLLGPESSNEQTFGLKYSSAITPPSAWRKEVSMEVDDTHQKTNARDQRDQRENNPPALTRPSNEATASSQETQDIPNAPGKERRMPSLDS
jgi:hypothetical protein